MAGQSRLTTHKPVIYFYVWDKLYPITHYIHWPFDYSHKIEVNSTEVGAEAVSNYEYERRLQDEKRNIKLLDPNYLPLFLEEFEKLTRE